jgi:hypothetical protein
MGQTANHTRRLAGERTGLSLPQELFPVKVDHGESGAKSPEEAPQASVCCVCDLIEHNTASAAESKVDLPQSSRHQGKPKDLVVRFVETKIVGASDIENAPLLEHPRRLCQNSPLIPDVLDYLVHRHQIEGAVCEWKTLPYSDGKYRLSDSPSSNLYSGQLAPVTDAVGFDAKALQPQISARRHKTAHTGPNVQDPRLLRNPKIGGDCREQLIRIAPHQFADHLFLNFRWLNTLPILQTVMQQKPLNFIVWKQSRGRRWDGAHFLAKALKFAENCSFFELMI